MVLRKKLVRHGNSYALILDKPILDMFGFEGDGEIELRPVGGYILLAPVSGRRGIPDAELEETLAWITKHHGETMRKLAE
jgi:antitoxin component of MazEF toxin-antitoxin module